MSRRLGEEVIVASEYARILFKSQEGLETISHELAHARLGRISRIFRRVLKQDKEGTPVKKSLKSLAQTRVHPYVKRFVSSLVAEKNIDRNLAQLSDTIISDENISVERLTRRIEVVSNALLLLPHVPILLPLVDVVNDALSQIPEESGMSSLSFAIPDSFKAGALIVAALIVIGILVLVRLRK
jgi:hypothetical protein